MRLSLFIHPCAGVNRDSVDVNPGSYTTFEIYVMFPLNSRGNWYCSDFYHILNYSLRADMLNNFYNYYYRINSALAFPSY